MQKRLSTLKTMPWSEEKKAQVELAVGSLAYTSSDESDLSDDENGTRRLSRYLIKRLPWERSTLTKAKRELDEAYIRSLNPRARVNLVTRGVHPRPSTRSPPIEALEWAVRAEEPTTTPSSRLSTSTRTATPSPRTRHLTSTTLSRSTHPPTMVTPAICTGPPSSHSTHPSGTQLTRTTPLSASSPSTSARPPSSSTHPLRSVTPSLTSTPRTSLISTPRTSKQKKTLRSKKDNDHNRSASPAY